MEDIIALIKQAIREQGITQKELAQRTSLAIATINRILNRKQELTITAKERILTALSLTEATINEDSSYPTLGFEVNGFLDFCGEITRVRCFKQVEEWVKKYKAIYKDIPKKAISIIRENERNKKKIEAHEYPEYDLSNIVFDREECYDATRYMCFPFKTGDDYVNGIKVDLGNQLNGYPFKYMGIEWLNSELLYLCGQFSNNTTEHIKIQRALAAENNGYLAKKNIKYPNAKLIRDDWDIEIAANWMLFVIWQKCRGNTDFVAKLKSIPREAIIIEESTKETTGKIWGCHNSIREESTPIALRYVEYKNPFATKKALNQLKEEMRNSLTYIGCYESGKNIMGKCLKIVQLALFDGKEPKIDYDLLKSKQIHLFGELLTF